MQEQKDREDGLRLRNWINKSNPWLRLFALALAVALVPIAWRTFALFDFGFRPRTFDLRGVWLDIVVSLWALFLISIAARGARILGLALIVFWFLLHYASYENVLVLQAFPNVSNLVYLGDAHFLAGSAAGVGNLGLALVILGVSLALAWWGMVQGTSTRQLLAVVAAAVGCTLIVPIWAAKSSVEEWRQTNAISEALTAGYGMVSRSFEEDASTQQWAVGELTPQRRALIETAFRTDLDGKPLAAADSGTQPNVLLIVIEGLSGTFVPSLRKHHAAPGTMELPYLDSLHREYYSVPNFIVHQRQTNRGVYSILSGRLPNLLSLSPKMSTAANRPNQLYLPGVLRDAGYRTVFMQATDMGFMMMDQFMVTAGFDETYSDEDYAEATLRTGWGVDDDTLFNYVSRRVLELEKTSQPWFLTALTCGSHHPYNTLVPEEFAALPGETDQARAFRFADQALERLLERLQTAGVLDHTLVIITSDESAGSMASTDALDRQISSNWGQMVVRLPNPRQHTVADAFGLSDVALSIVDYLALSDQTQHFHGRSIFRDYATPRSLFFANNSSRTVGVFNADSELHVTSEAEDGPSFRARFDPERIFVLDPIADPTDYRDTLITLGLRVDADQVESTLQSRTITIASGNYVFENAKQKNFQWVFGGQYLVFEADTVLVFDVGLTVHTDPNNTVQLKTELHHHSSDPRLRERETTKFTRELRNGERFDYRIVYRTGGDPGAVELNQYIKTEMDVPVRVDFSKAQVVATPRSEFVGPLPVPRSATYSVD